MKLLKMRYLCLVIALMCLAASPAVAWLRLMGGPPQPPATPTITGVTVAGTTTPSYTSGASSVGAVAVAETGGTFSGTLAIGGAANFSLSATSLPANVNTSQTCTSTTNYTITITPTQAGVVNSGTAYSITVTCNPASQTIALGPSTGTCPTGATNTCATMVATMTPASPPFNGTGGDGGTYTLVSAATSGGVCTSIDPNYSTDFSLNGTSGVLAIANTSIAVATYNVCVQAATTSGTVTNTPQFQQVAVSVTAAGSPTEIGAGVTLVNNGATASNTPVRFGYGYARGDMPLGNTIVCKDEGGTTYPCQIDELSTRTGMPMATDIPGWLHSTVSLIYTPSWTAGASHTFHIYKQSGAYTPGTGLTTAALTSAHHYQVLYNNVKNYANVTSGSGNFTCDLNNAITAGGAAPGTISGVGAGVASGGGGYVITENGQIETTIEALAPAIDNTAGTAHGQIMCRFFVMMWQASPGSGTLGQVEIATWIGEPWQNSSSGNLGFYWGDASLYDAAISTTLRNYSHSTNFGPSDVHPDPTSWDFSNNQNSIAWFGAICSANCPGGSYNNTLTVSGGTVSGASFGYNFYGNPYGTTPYFYVGSGNTNCTAGGYKITSAISSGSFTISTTNIAGGALGASCSSISNWQIGTGNITNYDNLQTGEGIVFSVSGGTLPASLQAGHLYFAGTPVNMDGHNSLDPFYISNVPMANGSDFWPSSQGVSDTGSCTSGSCFTVTRKVYMRPWAGNWLMADDIGTPFWVAGTNPANGARLYPQLSSAQKTYWSSTALFPPYNISAGFSVPSPPPLPIGNPNCSENNAGVYYEPGAVGPQEVCITLGGTHMGLGNMGGLTANWFLQPTQHPIDWDYVHTDALSETNINGSAVLNAETGYMTPYDCGLYPGCRNFPAALQKSGVTSSAHAFDYMLHADQLNTTWSGFTNIYTGDTSFLSGYNQGKDYPDFHEGPYYLVATGQNAYGTHAPDFGNPAAYLIGGEPWYLRSVQLNANHAMLAKYTLGDQGATNEINARDATINGVHYYGILMFGDQEQRGPAWSMRELMYGGVLGADNDPQKQELWNYLIENIDYTYALVHQYYSNNVNSVSGGSPDPNYESSGQCNTENLGASTFKYAYLSNVISQIHGIMNFSSSTLPGSSTNYVVNACTLYLVHQFTDQTTLTDTAGNTLSSFWSADDQLTLTKQVCSIYVPNSCPAALPSGYFVNTGESGWRQGYITTGGVIYNKSGYYNTSQQGLMQNGDIVRPSAIDNGNSFNSMLDQYYYVINLNPTGDPAASSSSGQNQVTFQVSTIPPVGPGSQACSAPTGSAGCPAPATLTNLPCTQPCNIAWRPKNAGSSSFFAGYACGGVNCTEGYAAEIVSSLQMDVDYNVTMTNLSTALSNILARYGGSMGVGDQTNLLWQEWAMGPVTVPNPPPPSQTIQSVTASPSTGTCVNLAQSNCTTVSVAMSATTPTFFADGGTFALVPATLPCTSGVDTTDFVISPTGVISISNINVTAASYSVCVKSQTTASQVTNSPQYLQVPITVTQGVPTVTFTGHSNFTYNSGSPVTNPTTVTGLTANNPVLLAAGYCATANCGSATPVPTLTATATSGTCAAVANTQSTGQVRQSQFFCCSGGAGGTQTYTINFGSAPQFVYTAASEFTGTNACSALEAANQTSGSSTTPSISTNGAISQSGGELVASFIYGQNSNTTTAAACGQLACQTPSAAGVITTNWSMPSGGNFGASTVALKHP